MKSCGVFLAAFLLVLAEPSLGHHRHGKRCPPPFGKMPFDSEKFAGDWFVVSRHVELPTPLPPEEKSCVKMTYNTSSAGNETRVSMWLQMHTDQGTEKEIRVTCQPLGGPPGKAGSVSQCVVKTDGDTAPMMPLVQHAILATDYDSYALVQYCGMIYSDKDDVFHRINLVDILSRSPTLSAESLRLLKSVASFDDVEPETFTDVDSSGC